MIKSKKSKIGIVLVLFFSSSFIYAQKDSTRKTKCYFWANIGVHAALSTNTTFILVPQLGLNFAINKKHYFKVNSYLSNALFQSVGSDGIQPNKLQWIENISFQYGIIKYNTESSATIISVGVSYGKAKYRGDFLYTTSGSGWLGVQQDVFDHDEHIYWGIPIDLTILSTSRSNGFSLDFYTNIHKYSDYGFRLNYNFGKIRDRNKAKQKVN